MLREFTFGETPCAVAVRSDAGGPVVELLRKAMWGRGAPAVTDEVMWTGRTL